MKAIKKKLTETNLTAEIVTVLAGYVKTQFLVYASVTGIVWIVLAALGVRYAVLLAFVTGALSTVPLIGMTIAAGIAGVVAVFDGARFLAGLNPIFEGIAILLIFFLINQLIDFFLAPYLLGKAAKIHPLLILCAVVIGTWVFGIPGAVLAVPVLLVTKTILKHYRKKNSTHL